MKAKKSEETKLKEVLKAFVKVKPTAKRKSNTSKTAASKAKGS